MNKALTAQNVELKRLIFRSHHRGSREMDLIFGQFADQKLTALNDADRALYAELIEEEDADLYRWIVKEDADFNARYASLLDALKQYQPAVYS